MTYENVFFRADEQMEALAVAKGRLHPLFEVIDRRSERPKPRMYIVGATHMMDFELSGMMKRMWVCRLVWRPGHSPEA